MTNKMNNEQINISEDIAKLSDNLQKLPEGTPLSGVDLSKLAGGRLDAKTLGMILGASIGVVGAGFGVYGMNKGRKSPRGPAPAATPVSQVPQDAPQTVDQPAVTARSAADERNKQFYEGASTAWSDIRPKKGAPGDKEYADYGRAVRLLLADADKLGR